MMILCALLEPIIPKSSSSVLRVSLQPPMFSRPLSDKSHIQIWAETVALETVQTQAHGILAPSSSNPRLGKRKATLEPLRTNPERACKKVRTISDENREEEKACTTPRRGRGRGRPSTCGQSRGRGQDILAGGPPEALRASASTSSGQTSRPCSPKRRGMTLDQAKKDASIDMKLLESCKPCIRRRTRLKAKREGMLPPSVADLLGSMDKLSNGFIPGRLKVRPDLTSPSLA